MDNFDITSEWINAQTTFITGKKLAKLLNVSTAAVSDAIKHNHQCGGQPICEWAEFSESGRVKGYDVPNDLMKELTTEEPQENGQQRQNRENRDNPDLMKLDSSRSKQHSAGQMHQEENKINPPPPPVTNVSKSLLPQGQDYSRTAGMVTLPQVLIKALDEDTSQSRAVIGFSSGAIGAILGGAVTESAGGAISGALLGWGGTWFTYWLSDRKKQPTPQPRFARPQMQMGQNGKESNFVRQAEPIEYDYV
jgi:predicted transcriptional regulator